MRCSLCSEFSLGIFRRNFVLHLQSLTSSKYAMLGVNKDNLQTSMADNEQIDIQALDLTANHTHMDFSSPRNS